MFLARLAAADEAAASLPVLWSGSGGRVVAKGVAVLAGPRAIITGLQKNAAYAVRVTALRRRRVAVGDAVLEQTAESEPSPAAGPFKTLSPATEIARLTG